MNMNIYNPYIRRELELYHHGIFGMRWGKKNGPPYPLAPSAHSASEKKAGWRKSLDSAKSEYKERKRSYKAASKEYMQAKKEYKVAKQDLKYAKDDRKAAKAGYKESKAGVKEARMDAAGGSLGVKEAKQARKDSKYEFDRAKFNEGKMRDTLKTKMSDLKTAKDKLKAEKILLREGKKLLRDAQDEAKTFSELSKTYKKHQDAVDKYIKFEENNTATAILTKKGRKIADKVLMDKELDNAADKLQSLKESGWTEKDLADRLGLSSDSLKFYMRKEYKDDQDN